MGKFKHFLLPSVSLVEDAGKILKELNLESASKFPKILATDASLAEVDCSLGDVIRVEGKNPVTGKGEVYYRVVVE